MKTTITVHYRSGPKEERRGRGIWSCAHCDSLADHVGMGNYALCQRCMDRAARNVAEARRRAAAEYAGRVYHVG